MRVVASVSALLFSFYREELAAAMRSAGCHWCGDPTAGFEHVLPQSRQERC